jgi:hypothetical protein
MKAGEGRLFRGERTERIPGSVVILQLKSEESA